MKNTYEKVRLVESLEDIAHLAVKKRLIQVAGWKKPVSASFISWMDKDTVDKLIRESKMHVVRKCVTVGGIAVSSKNIKMEKKPAGFDRPAIEKPAVIYVDEVGEVSQDQIDALKGREISSFTMFRNLF